MAPPEIIPARACPGRRASLAAGLFELADHNCARPEFALSVFTSRSGLASVRIVIRRIVSVLAIYLIAITTILWGFSAVQPSGAAFDPFTIICHSGPQDASPSDAGDAPPVFFPQKACSHCILCNVAPTASATFDSFVIGPLGPTKTLCHRPPTELASREHIGGSPRQAQGPPSAL